MAPWDLDRHYGRAEASIVIILPCLDEAAALPWVLARIPSAARAIVVDNGSSDGSARLASSMGATVVQCYRGYGAACLAGLEAARADVVATCDCDATIDPRDVVAAAAALARADLVLGRRRASTRAAWSVPSRIANRELARRVSRRSGRRILDVSPVRIARTDDLRSLQLREQRGGHPVETVLHAAAAGWRIEHVSIGYHERIGSSKVTGTFGGYLRTVREMSAVLA